MSAERNNTMSKGQNKKKDLKKEPAKTIAALNKAAEEVKTPALREQMNALIKSSLSPRGSRIRPAGDCCLDLRAI
jgi:hypothetical protein